APRGAGVNELARAIEVNPSTASRLLGTLERGRMVQRQADGRFRLGLHLVALAEATLSGLDVRELARPVLRELVALTGETATLSVPGGADAITVDFVPAQASVVSVARLGRPSVGHATATGKVMLAFGGAAQGRGERALIAYTAHTVTGPAALSAEVAGVRDRGWAQAVGEREPDLNALAAPVLARGGELVGILGLQGPAGRLTEQRREEVLGALLDAAARLSRALGGQLQG
ncbi:MAG: IclR family transcriptional regulator, partial [Solirubrobacterales bacterium]|nr:IclR family transcriptional regulator [Solirubrobacterales bacterium]